jgi:hypothetical protein
MKTNAIERVARIAAKCSTAQQATRLWNWIDAQPEPEPLWLAMLAAAPRWFETIDVNSIHFAY